MRLADFISANLEPILAEWEVFARNIWPGPAADPATLRDHAEALLLATVSDMQTQQTKAQQSEKSKGRGSGEGGARLDGASVTHAVERAGSGLDLDSVVAEYRALRASVLRLWRESGPTPDVSDIDDLTRFNESIDQSLTEAVRGYVQHVERERGVLMENEQAARTEAEAANRAKDVFLATLSHEMRTPLSAIAGWTSILRIKGCAQKDLDEGLDVIERNTRAQVRLIEDILDVSRIVSGKLRIDVRRCELTEVINEAVHAVRPAAEARGIELDVQLDRAASAVSGDAMRLQQVVWNLVSNAVKFTSKGGRASVTLARDGSAVRIQVSDSGQGISPELLPYVFERFRQADGGTRRQFGGLGLGLSIVKHIVEQHGGTVEAMSPGAGCGATFTVRLPILALRTEEHGQDEGAAREAGESTAEKGQRGPDLLPLARLDGLRVLVVDDEADARRLLVKVLEQTGAIVTAAASAAEALEMLPKVQPHIAGQRPWDAGAGRLRPHPASPPIGPSPR
jgi:signal transduction histidine kinase